MKTLLFVDDEAVFLQLMREVFETAGYTVVTVQSGQEAVAKVEELDLGAVFLDLRMPGMDGVEVFHRIQGIAPKLPVLIVSGHAHEDLARSLLQEGAFDFVPKPVDLARLRETVRQLDFLEDVESADDA